MNARTFFIDRLRVVLSALVIVFHTAIVYGAAGGWYWREVDDLARPLSLVLTVFCAVCQSFFMGFFFLLAGYFSPPSLARKGVRAFVIDRLLRLGIPLLFYGFVVGTATSAMVRSSLGPEFFSLWLGMIRRGVFNVGPLWFAEALLVFTAGFTVWSLVFSGRERDERPAQVPSPRRWVVWAVLVGVGALVIRAWFPLGRDVAGMNLGYFSSYVFLFVFGCIAWDHRWLERIERKHARPWGWLSLAVVPVLPIVAISTGVFSGAGSALAGGQSAADIVYAFWDPLVAWGIIAVLLWQFRVRCNAPSARWDRWASRAYAAYIIHPAVVVGVSMSAHALALPTFLKFLLVSTIAVVSSFAIAGVMRRMPGAQHVL
ncbi:acyltransferase family protein [Gemmatimonas groenlandica]|uniref:Acyltransferase family protein n=1 Tax=Gemmatimonas groenlandica TaxID=2732249 RepID=A0A6M4IKX4_9BACT|nr:acyltransferase family protein [Gemmatimonas groenlandica]QJR35684.1 acyltransferase family protein [Gemmatimonas groenlandica]